MTGSKRRSGAMTTGDGRGRTLFVWLVTVRAAHGCSPAVNELLSERLMPMLRAQSECLTPAVAQGVNCGGEYSYLGYWRDREALEAFEATPAYQELVGALTPLLRLPPKRELWQVLSR